MARTHRLGPTDCASALARALLGGSPRVGGWRPARPRALRWTHHPPATARDVSTHLRGRSTTRSRTVSTSERQDLVSSLVHYLYGAGFRNVRSRADGLPTPLAFGDDSVTPDVTSRSGIGNLDVYLVLTADELDVEEHVERVRRAAATAAEEQARFWLAVPSSDLARAKARLGALGVQARIMRV